MSSPSTARPSTRARRSSTLNDMRRESVWNLISKFPTPFTTDAAASKTKELRQRLRPTLEPIKVPGSPDFRVSFLDLSSSLDSIMFPASKASSSEEESHRGRAVLDTAQSPIYESPEEIYYNISLSPEDHVALSNKTLRRPSSAAQLSSQLRSHWSDDSSNEDEDGDNDADDDADNSSPLSPTFLFAWRNRFATRTSMISRHRHSRSLPSPAAPVSPRSKPRTSSNSKKSLEQELDEEVSMSQILEDGPVVTVRQRTWSNRVPRRLAAEDVASQFGQWRGFSPRS